MGYTVTEFQTTPNPNALKCILSASPAPQGPRSYLTKEAAANDPLAAALFAIPGVRNLLIHHGWITIGKDPAADWKPLKRELQRVLKDAPEPGPAP